MKKMIGLVALLALAGCAHTLDGVTSETPEFVESSHKSVEEYSDCLKNSWLDYGPTFVKPIEGGSRVFNNFGSAVGNAADVLQTASGTTVKFYNPNVLTPKKFKQAAKDCL